MLGKWPDLQIPIPISLFPKPNGGDRPIGVTHCLMALYIRSQSDLLTSWEEEHMRFWEDAVKGSSARRAGLMLPFMATAF